MAWNIYIWNSQEHHHITSRLCKLMCDRTECNYIIGIANNIKLNVCFLIIVNCKYAFDK